MDNMKSAVLLAAQMTCQKRAGDLVDSIAATDGADGARAFIICLHNTSFINAVSITHKNVLDIINSSTDIDVIRQGVRAALNQFAGSVGELSSAVLMATSNALVASGNKSFGEDAAVKYSNMAMKLINENNQLITAALAEAANEDSKPS